MAQSANSTTNFPTLEQALDDVEARFLYNLPKSELEHTERLFFQIEQAYWFYEDFKADVYSHLPHFSTLKAFATKLFSYSALLSKAGDKFQELFTDYRNYKSKIPVYGCIMLNPPMTKVVLVCDYNGKSWTFPRGKINENETEFSCAVREVYEETGFDPSPHCKEEDNLLAFIDGKQIKLFVACNVPETTVFTIMTRKEISEVAFHPLDALPKTYAVNPFLEKLKRWITKRKQLNAKMLKSPPLKANAAAGKSPARNATGGAAQPSSKQSRRAAAANGGAADKSPLFPSSSPVLGPANGSGGSHVMQPSPNTAKRIRNLFDMRNSATFEAEQAGWGVDAMFAANARITGKSYKYDGNPHQFGAAHPKYVNYANASDAVSSRSVFGASPQFSSLSPTPLDELRKNAYMAGIAGAAQLEDDEGFRALSEQSLLGNQLLRSSRAKDPTDTVRPEDFALPLSAFKFDHTQLKPPRHDSFDSTHSRDYQQQHGFKYSADSAFDPASIKVVFPVKFQLDRVAIMAAFDKALSKGR
jgi:mRNA-decapping enzyme subunit 2